MNKAIPEHVFQLRVSHWLFFLPEVSCHTHKDHLICSRELRVTVDKRIIIKFLYDFFDSVLRDITDANSWGFVFKLLCSQLLINRLSHDMQTFSDICLMTTNLSTNVLNRIFVEHSLTALQTNMKNLWYLVDCILRKNDPSISETRGDLEWKRFRQVNRVRNSDQSQMRFLIPYPFHYRIYDLLLRSPQVIHFVDNQNSKAKISCTLW